VAKEKTASDIGARKGASEVASTLAASIPSASSVSPSSGSGQTGFSVAASAIGMGLAAQSGGLGALAASVTSGDGTPNTVMFSTDEGAASSLSISDAAVEEGVRVLSDLNDGTLMGGSESDLFDETSLAEALDAAADGVALSGGAIKTAADIPVAASLPEDAGEDGIASSLTATTSWTQTATEDGVDLLDSLTADDGIVGGLLDGIVGEDGLLDSLLGEEGFVDDLLDALLGEDGLLGGLLGEDGLLGVLVGDEGLLSDLLGQDGVLDALVGEGGLLESLAGEDGLIDALVEVLIGDDGLLGGLFGDDSILDDLLGDVPLVGDLLGDDGLLTGLLDPLLGEDGLVAGLVGEEGLVGSVLDGIVGEDGILDELVEDIPLLDPLLGSDGLVGTLLGEDGLVGTLLGEGSLLGGLLGGSESSEDTAAAVGEVVADVTDEVAGSGDVIVDTVVDAAETVVDAAGEALDAVGDGVSDLIDGDDDGFLDGLLGASTVDGDLGGEDTLLAGLLVDDDPFGLALEDVSAVVGDVVDDLFAGLAGVESLAGMLVDGGIIDPTDSQGSAVEYDPEVDGLLSDILGLGTGDILGADSEFETLLDGDGGAGESGSDSILGDTVVEEALGVLFGDGETLLSGLGVGDEGDV
jgi:hypothetical protein